MALSDKSCRYVCIHTSFWREVREAQEAGRGPVSLLTSAHSCCREVMDDQLLGRGPVRLLKLRSSCSSFCVWGVEERGRERGGRSGQLVMVGRRAGGLSALTCSQAVEAQIELRQLLWAGDWSGCGQPV